MPAKPTSDSTIRIRTRRGGEVLVETLWATSLGRDRYRLDNIPLYATGVSFQDVVLAPMVNGVAEFRKVVQKSGMQTLRAVFDGDGSAIINKLNRFGCQTGMIDEQSVSINIPTSLRREAISDFLDEQNVRWSFADPMPKELLMHRRLQRAIKKRFKWIP